MYAENKTIKNVQTATALLVSNNKLLEVFFSVSMQKESLISSYVYRKKRKKLFVYFELSIVYS